MRTACLCKDLKEGDWLEDLVLYGRIIKMRCKGTRWDAVEWINLVLIGIRGRGFVNTVN
jgi:hypothetical protein